MSETAGTLNVLRNDDIILASHPSEIYRAMSSTFSGLPWLSWEPETILSEMSDDVSELAQDKVLAVQAFAANPGMAFTHAVPFEKVVDAFNNGVCVMDELQPPYIEEVCYAVRQMHAIVNDLKKERESNNWQSTGGSTDDLPEDFDGEVPGYVAAIAKYRDWAVLPKMLSFAQQRVNFINGIADGSRIYREHGDFLEKVNDLYSSMTREDAVSLLESPDMTELSTNDTDSLVIKRIIGALVYDPTILYS